MIKLFFQRLYAQKKLMNFIGSTVMILLAVAVVIGILNGLLAEGTWSFGWSSYRYDETGYEMGSGTVPSRSVTDLEIDWIDGSVELILCDDAGISLTESYQDDVPDTALLRYKLSSDGTKLSIKYRASAAFLGCGGTGINKTLIVRIPRAMADMKSVSITAESATISSDGISAKAFGVTSKNGSVKITNAAIDALTVETVSGDVDINAEVLSTASLYAKSGDLHLYTIATPSLLDLNTKKGNVRLSVPSDCGFLLELEGNTDRFSCDRMLSELEGAAYSFGDESTRIKISAPKGSVSVNTSVAK